MKETLIFVEFSDLDDAKMFIRLESQEKNAKNPKHRQKWNKRKCHKCFGANNLLVVKDINWYLTRKNYTMQ